ncbi:ABC transporter permease [Parvibium lacunae]|uniref:ABC transporter permease n=1 Tax=Parvibium lacunae TaxID=1888893 RepID=A0A368L3H9_9BURK|nr:FtsX-like permease family protein [Parvibium lacunae]RCS58129.1 ABC transporter permease [Parvibium lacunae]
MKAIIKLAVNSAWARRQTLIIVLFSIALSTAVLLAVERVRTDARASFTQSVSGVDLVVGARTSPVQLMLYAVFHTGNATQNIRIDNVERLATHPDVAWAIPLSLGDSHQGFPVLGTTPQYFSHLRYGLQQPLFFAKGKSFGGTVDTVFEAVIGHQVAKTLGYTIGDKITLSHGMQTLGPEHADKPFRVVGILAPTGTPIDRTVHVSLEAITAVHLDWMGGVPLPGVKIPAEHVRKFDLRPQDITAILIGLNSRSTVFKLQRHINNDPGEPLLAVMPGVALDELWQTLTMVENLLLLVSSLVVIVGLAGLTATLMAGLTERRRELAILRALGAGPRDLFLMLTAEGIFITVLGIALGYVLLAVGITSLAPLLQSQFGIVVLQRLPTYNEWWLIGAILLTGLVASLLPGWRAWRISLADGLTPRY